MSHRGRFSVVLLLTFSLAAIVRGDGAKAGGGDKPVSIAGLYTDAKPEFAMIWTDGEDEPVKYTYDASCDKSQIGKMTATGIFPPIRVQITYVNADGGRKLMSIRRERPLEKGVIVGTVMFCDGKFWVAVKPANGPLDGFALNWPPNDTHETLKKLQKGDIVGIRFHTDFERHRIDALEVKPPAPPAPEKPVPATQPQATGAPTPAAVVATPTSQPAMSAEAKAQAKLKLALLYIENDHKEQGRAALRDLVKLYPDTDAAKEATEKLAAMGE